jgi:hypothetical protein
MQIVEPLVKCEVLFLSSQVMRIWTVSVAQTLQIKPRLHQMLEMPYIPLSEMPKIPNAVLGLNILLGNPSDTLHRGLGFQVSSSESFRKRASLCECKLSLEVLGMQSDDG